MNQSKIITFILGALLVFSLTGCKKEQLPHQWSDKTEVAFAISAISGPEVNITKTAVPMPADTEFRIIAMVSGGTDFSAPVADVRYMTSDGGVAIPRTENDRLLLASGKYDFYFSMPTNLELQADGRIAVANGLDFMSVKKTDIEIGTASQVVDVEFRHQCSAINLTITADNNLASMAIASGSKITGLPGDTYYEIASQTMSYGTVKIDYEFNENAFVTTGNGSLTEITMLNPGVALHTGVDLQPTIELNMTLNGLAKIVKYTMPDALVAGNMYNVTLVVNSTGVVTSMEVSVTPWEIGAAIDGGLVDATITIGEFLHYGLVFWVNPADPLHYKVLSPFTTSNTTWDIAFAKYSGIDLGWRMPTTEELQEIYNIRKDNLENSFFDKALQEYTGTPIDEFIWSGYVAGANASRCNMKTGVVDTHPRTERIQARSIKEIGGNKAPIIDYCDKPANCYISYPIDGRYASIEFDALKKPRAKSGNVAHRGFTNGSIVELYNPINTIPNMAYNPIDHDLSPGTGPVMQVVWQTLEDNGSATATGGVITENYSTYYPYSSATPSSSKALIKNVRYCIETGKCLVELNGAGNALLALQTPEGDILWTWHIWSTESEPQANVNPAGEPTTNPNGNGKLFMDRNLGALAATTTKPIAFDNAHKYFGLLYQWGRREPFTSQGVQYNATGNQSSNIATAVFKHDGSLWGTGNPTSGTAGGFIAGMKRVGSSFETMANPMILYFGIEANPDTWTNAATPKSIYDPCPYGYRVPAKDSWKGWSSKPSNIANITSGAEWNGSWWPAAGNRSADAKVGNFGYHGFYWTSEAKATSNTSYACNLKFTSTGFVSNEETSRGNAYSVRCVQE